MVVKLLNNFNNMLNYYFTQEELDKIQSCKVGIAGLGGLGSNCAFNLVRSGFVNFYLYDYDVVEINNLNRQFYFLDQIGKPKILALEENLRKINPELNIVSKQIKIDKDNIKELFKECNVIVEAFDDAIFKKILAEEFLNSNKLIVSVSGIAGIGGSEKIQIRKIKRNFFLIGDFESEVNQMNKAYSPKVNVAASIQADIILRWVLGYEK